MPYQRLNYRKRIQIETLIQQKIPIKKIADTIGVHRSTIYRELSKGQYTRLRTDYSTYQTYSADKGEAHAKFHRTTVGAQLKIGNDHQFVQYCTQKIKDKYSPMAILYEIQRKHLTFKTQVCRSTLYNYINAGLFYGITSKDLIRKGKLKRRNKDSKPIKQPMQGISIDHRPEEISQRDEFGHWEIDTVIGKRTKGQCLLTFTERATRFEFAYIVASKEAKETERIMNALQKVLGKKFSTIFKSFTCDNGSEFKTLHRMPSMTVYYCHPYCSWERGTNENQNGFIRRFIPKRTPIENIDQIYLETIIDFINAYPRSIFNGKSSQQMVEETLKNPSLVNKLLTCRKIT